MMSRRTSYNREAKKGKMMEEGNCAFELKRRWLEIVWQLKRKRWNRETPQTGQQRSRQTRNPESAERSETEKQKQRKQQQGSLQGAYRSLPPSFGYLGIGSMRHVDGQLGHRYCHCVALAWSVGGKHKDTVCVFDLA